MQKLTLYKTIIIQGIIAGMISGLFLALIMKFIEHFTAVKVYTLLLNIDYIPVLKNYSFSESVEVILHLIVSICLAIILYFLIVKLQLKKAKVIIFFSVICCFFVGVLLYPTTAFSNRTPPLNSLIAISYWITCHTLYGYVVGFVFTRCTKKQGRL